MWQWRYAFVIRTHCLRHASKVVYSTVPLRIAAWNGPKTIFTNQHLCQQIVSFFPEPVEDFMIGTVMKAFLLQARHFFLNSTDY
jgi:hypothetical protein